MGDDDPGLGAGDCGLEVLGQPTASIEPGEGSLDDPSARQELEAFGLVGSLDDLDRPLADAAQPAAELLAAIAPIGEDVAKPGIPVTNGSQQVGSAIAILNAATLRGL